MADPLTRDEFAWVVGDVVMRMLSDPEYMSFDKERYVIVINDGHVSQEIPLSGYFDEYCQTDESGQEAIFTKAIRSVFPDFANGTAADEGGIDFKSRLLVQVKDRWSVERLNLSLMSGSGGSQDAEIVQIPYSAICEHFALLVAYDMPEQMSYVTTQQLKDWGIEFGEAFDIAAQNLYQRSQFTWDIYQDKDGGMLVARTNWKDHYDAARSIFIDEIRQIPVAGETIVFLLNQLDVMISGTESPMGMILALDELMKAQATPHALPPFLLRLQGDGFSFYELPQDCPVWEPIHQMQMEYMFNLYFAQRELLEGEHKQLLGARRIGAYELGKMTETGILTSCRIDPDRIPMLLPYARTFVLVRGDEAVQTSWQSFVEVMDKHLLEPTFYPPLMELIKFPSDEELRRIATLNARG